MSKKIKVWGITLLLCGLIGVLFYHNVSKRITSEDRIYISRYLQALPDSVADDLQVDFDELDYGAQLELLGYVQEVVLNHNPPGKGIPHHAARNPKELYESGIGQCYDRSFLLEKVLASMGGRTRHVSAYLGQSTQSKWQVLCSREARSHAFLEVQTARGWLIVEPDFQWLAIDMDQKPISCKQLVRASVNWRKDVPQKVAPFYSPEAVHVYGLYSRHGRFFAPYNRIPDYRLQELLYNCC